MVDNSLKVTQQESTEAGFTPSRSHQTDLAPVQGLFNLDSFEPLCLCPSLLTEGLRVSDVCDDVSSEETWLLEPARLEPKPVAFSMSGTRDL